MENLFLGQPIEEMYNRYTPLYQSDMYCFGGEYFLCPLEVILLGGAEQDRDTTPGTCCSSSSSEAALVGMGFSRGTPGWDEWAGMRF